jgi:hypothetical protein
VSCSFTVHFEDFIECPLLLLALVRTGRVLPVWVVLAKLSLLQPLRDRRRVDRARHPKRAGVGPASKRQLTALRIRVQPSTATGCASIEVWDDENRTGFGRSARSDPRHDDAEQLGGHRPLAAPDTGSDRTSDVKICVH